MQKKETMTIANPKPRPKGQTKASILKKEMKKNSLAQEKVFVDLSTH